MLTIDDLTIRIGARLLIDRASVFIADGWKVGLIGRNGSGKSTLLRHIQDEARASGEIRIAAGARIGAVEQEAPQSDEVLLAYVVSAHAELAALLGEAEHASDPHRIAEIHERLGEIDAYSAEARAAGILIGLGFSQTDLSRACREFSGGWRMRAALARILFYEPELLLLDEPTNYLDLEGAAWLENFLQSYRRTVLIVSHDRDTLNASVTHILALENAKLELHPGGYDTYLRKRAERAALQGALRLKQDAERARMQSFIDRFRAKASKARQAQSRMKMLERMQDITIPIESRALPFHFDEPQPLASPLVVLNEASLGYSPRAPILSRVSLRLDHDDRIAIIGANGQGKTTLVKSLAARLPLLGGDRHGARNLKIGYFSQDQLDELRAGETVLEHVRDLAPNAPTAQQRALAARMGFGPEKIDTIVERLSGGEKVRLLLGLMAHPRPHILILDEPTSHLDIDSREALAHALNEFSGAVLLITHDAYLAEACADRLWLVKNGAVANYEGDLSAYRALVLSAERTAPARGAKDSEGPRKSKSAGPSASTLRRRLDEAEAALTKAQATLARLDAALAEPHLFTRDPARGADLARERDSAAVKLAELEERWLLANDALDEALSTMRS